MKCRACWAEKAYRRKIANWRDRLLACCGLVPLKCQHCFAKSWIPWFWTLGKRLDPPAAGQPHAAVATPDAPPQPAAQVPRRRQADGDFASEQRRSGRRRAA